MFGRYAWLGWPGDVLVEGCIALPRWFQRWWMIGRLTWLQGSFLIEIDRVLVDHAKIYFILLN
jgi:hypothetical protein